MNDGLAQGGSIACNEVVNGEARSNVVIVARSRVRHADLRLINQGCN